MKTSLIKKAWNTFRQKGFTTLLRKFWDFSARQGQPIFTKLEPLLYPYAAWKVARDAKKPHSAVSALDFLFNEYGHLITPKQVRLEITELAKIVETLKPQVVVEIGTAKGGTLFLFSRLATDDATVVSIDLPWEVLGGYPNWKKPLYEKFAGPSQKLNLLRADSHDQKTFNDLTKILAGAKIDFLFIDGDHTYEGVKKDYELYSPLVRSGGVIALHDVAHHEIDPACQVDRFWNEVKLQKNVRELVKQPTEGWGGIGVIFN